jgi:transposase InsO family protein
MATMSEKIIKPKLGLLELAKQLGSVSQACKAMGYSRDSFYRFKKLYENGGVEALQDLNKKVPNVKNRVADYIEQAVCDIAVENPAFGQLRASNELKLRGVLVSPAGVRSIWLRHDLESLQKRLKALSAKVAQDGLILTEDQVKALERAKQEKEAHGEIETEYPGYLVSQDTYFVGTIKGVGRVYQQTGIDTYSRVAFAKLYTDKTAVTAADLLNDKIIPFFDEHKIKLLRMLTDRGTEYCGNIETHAYQLYLAVEDIDHSKTKARHPQTNGICERFHRTMKDEFYSVAFRKKIYHTIDEIQHDLDDWLNKYNTLRPHTGRYCYGKTPMKTFLDSKHLAIEKQYGLSFDDHKGMSDSLESSDTCQINSN